MCWVCALAPPSGAGAAPPVETQSAQALLIPSSLLRDEEFCLGCHGAGSQAKGAPRVDIQAIHGSVHQTATCVDCHQGIATVPHGLPVSPANCERCHREAVHPGPLAPTGKSAPLSSTHDLVRQRGLGGTPTCANCHGGHDVLPTSDPGSRLGRRRIAKTCGACHAAIAADYLASVHGKALLSGNRDVPSCETCHAEHLATRRGVLQRGVVATCVSCHEDPGLQRRYALPANRLASYLGSYHGAASELGDSRTANCATCHRAHLILPSSDPRSSVNRANLPQTCGRCHPGATTHFAEGRIHLQPSPSRDRGVFFVRIAYQGFIVGLMSAFAGYICLDLVARVRQRAKRGSARPTEGRRVEEEPQFERLTLNQRAQHWVLITSFVTLLVTGLPLASPGSAVSRGVISFLGGMGARAVIHRAAATLLIAIVCYHALYVLFSRRGYWEFRQLLPRLQDGKDLLQMLRFYFGLAPIRAEFGRYNYIEKFEYLAVGWGSVVMIGSGALLWAPQISLILLPKWVMDIALIVHSWEAILAFLAIIVWHMYNVHWNPSVFPMSQVWLTGKIGLREFRENHPREYVEAGREQGVAGSHSAPPGADQGSKQG